MTQDLTGSRKFVPQTRKTVFLTPDLMAKDLAKADAVPVPVVDALRGYDVAATVPLPNGTLVVLDPA